MSNKDIIFQSTYDNIKAFMEGKSLDELVNLYLYIMGTESMERPPSPLEREFIKEFFTDDAWAVFINNRQREAEGFKSFFKHIPPFDLHTISGILSFEIMKLIGDKLTNIEKVTRQRDRLQSEKKFLKQELGTAIDNSYDDGIFYKVEGFCNLADVLEKFKLIKLKEE